MSWATIRTRSPARRTLPSSSVATWSVAPISRRLCSRFLNGITDVREITLRERIFDSWAITSSVMPSAKNSFSGSALRFRNGSTATEGGLRAPSLGRISASANSPADANRSAGTGASAFMSACSTASGTVVLRRRTRGIGSVNRLAITACAVVAGIRRLAGEQLVEYAAEAVHVAPSIEGPLAGGLFRTHVLGRSHREPHHGEAFSAAAPRLPGNANAIPKSVTIASPSWSRMFSGLMSR